VWWPRSALLVRILAQDAVGVLAGRTSSPRSPAPSARHGAACAPTPTPGPPPNPSPGPSPPRTHGGRELVLTGLRISEALNARVTDLGHRALTVTRKGRPTRPGSAPPIPEPNPGRLPRRADQRATVPRRQRHRPLPLPQRLRPEPPHRPVRRPTRRRTPQPPQPSALLRHRSAHPRRPPPRRPGRPRPGVFPFS